MRQRMKSKLETAHAQLQFEKEHCWMQQVRTLFLERSGAPKEERDLATQLIKKRTNTSLASIFNSKAKKMCDEFERNGMFEPEGDAPQQPPVPEKHEDVKPTPTLDDTLPVGTQNKDTSAEEKEDEQEADELPNTFLESMKDFEEK